MSTIGLFSRVCDSLCVILAFRPSLVYQYADVEPMCIQQLTAAAHQLTASGVPQGEGRQMDDRVLDVIEDVALPSRPSDAESDSLLDEPLACKYPAVPLHLC
jgi:hypothetical protein